MSLLLLLLLGACGREAQPTPAPTRTPLPTFTATPLRQNQGAPLTPPTTTPVAATTPVAVVAATGVPAVAPAPVDTPTDTPTPAAQPQLSVNGDAVNIRQGPDTGYAVIASADQGQIFPVTGRTAAEDWWQICCFDGRPGWIFAALTTVQNTGEVAVIEEIPALPPTATPAPVAAAPTALPAVTEAPAVAAAPDPAASSAGFFDPNAAYQITQFRVLGLDENNGGIRSSTALHYILVTVLDAGGNPVDGAVVRNLVGEKGEVVSGSKGPGTAEITMFWEPFKLTVVADPSGPTTSQVSNQMGLAFPHLPDIVGRLGGLDYEYAVCPTLDVKCAWPIQGVHFSYEITFQKVR